MRSLIQERARAIELRQKGSSYRDILAEVPVAKSTLSLWLKNFPLTSLEKEALKGRRDANISRGRMRAASALRSNRLIREQTALSEAQALFKEFKDDVLFNVGIALYWAEGSKRQASNFTFTNSDPDMIALMVLWAKRYLGVNPEQFRVRLYIHKPYANENCEEFWHKKTAIPKGNFRRTIYKPTGLLVKKRPDYKGCLRMEFAGRSTLLKMLFWQNMLIGESHKE